MSLLTDLLARPWEASSSQYSSLLQPPPRTCHMNTTTQHLKASSCLGSILESPRGKIGHNQKGTALEPLGINNKSDSNRQHRRQHLRSQRCGKYRTTNIPRAPQEIAETQLFHDSPCWKLRKSKRAYSAAPRC